MASNASQVARVEAIQQINTWLEGQRERLDKVAVVAQASEAHGILQAVENAWSEYEQSGYMVELSPNPGHHFNPQGNGRFLPLNSQPTYALSSNEQKRLERQRGNVQHRVLTGIHDWGSPNTEPNPTT